jgi:prepilin-type N-terminal cleavage/methylation domain-containing protein
MLSKLKKSKSEGFTIIEVMIVLAIAGLILLIVFLAIPALQRNSRNTQRKSDASAMGAAIANFTDNNNGALPTSEGNVTADAKSVSFYCNGATPDPAVTNRNSVVYAAANCAGTNNNSEQAKIGLYDLAAANVILAHVAVAPTVGTPASAPSTTNVTINSVVINLGNQCANVPSGVPIATPRSVSLYYVTESGGTGNGNLNCIGG